MPTRQQSLEKTAELAKLASRKMALIPDKIKRAALNAASEALLQNQDKILKANEEDVREASKKKLSPALIDRLLMNLKRITDLAKAVREIASQADPVGEVVEAWESEDGMKLKRVRVPLGVIAMIYESRPNVTAESAALCIKAGNSVILRGGSESLRSNLALSGIFSRAVRACGVPENAVSFISDTDRRNIYKLCQMDRWVDLCIARGSEEMVREIRRRSAVPVLGHGKGVCHVYVDAKADLKMAEEIAFNAKVQRPGVCNAMETLIVHRKAAKSFLPAIAKRYLESGVLLKGDSETRKLVKGIEPALEKDWRAEYLDLVLSIKVVDTLDSAIDHINTYGSGHTDAIVTEDASAAKIFAESVDSAAVLHNASTRMHDGGVFGLGAEIGISTQKLHARGTMGARELTTTKYIVSGSGHVRK